LRDEFKSVSELKLSFCISIPPFWSD